MAVEKSIAQLLDTPQEMEIEIDGTILLDFKILGLES